MTTGRPLVHLCTGHPCRSQMAEGFAHHLVGDRWEVASAGIKPSVVNPLAVAVMAEVKDGISRHASKRTIRRCSGAWP